MAAADLTLAAPLTVTTSYGQACNFSYLHFDAKSHRCEVGWETNDGVTPWTGKFFKVIVDDTGCTYYYTNGTTSFDQNLKFTNAGVQAIIAQATLGSFGQAHVA